MANLKTSLSKYASLIDSHWDKLSFNFKLKLGLNNPVQIIPYRTYGTTTRF